MPLNLQTRVGNPRLTHAEVDENWTDIQTLVNANETAITTKQNSTYTPSGTGAVGRTVESKLNEVSSVKDFGAVGDGITDDTSAIQSALSSKTIIYFPSGTYLISGTLNLSKNGHSLIGDGMYSSIIKSNSTSLPIITFSANRLGINISNLQLDRSVTAISGGNGIDCSTVSCDHVKINNLLVQNQWIGLKLGATAWSNVRHCIITKCLDDGVYITNTPALGTCQWSLDSVLSQMNSGRGFIIQSVSGPSSVTCGNVYNCATFANTGLGFAAVGLPGSPLNGVRIHECFFGGDGDSEIYLDTYGRQHLICDTFCELAGTRTTGPSLSTPASNTGQGIYVTSNNTGTVEINDVHCNGNSLNGIRLDGVTHLVTGAVLTNNGLASVSSERNGVRLVAGTLVMSGGHSGNTSGTSQEYGVRVYDGDQASLIGVNLSGNGVSSTLSGTNSAYLTIIGCLPNTLNVGLSPRGAVLVGGGATGAWGSAGTINVDTNILKDNVAYTNP